MKYKIPDLNKIGLETLYKIKSWDELGIHQSLQPRSDFGLELPIKEGDSIICHCVDGGDVFLALATRLDCDWIVSDVRKSVIEHVRKKVEDPDFRASDIASYPSNRGIKGLGERIKEGMKKDGEPLKNRRITYITGNSNYLGLPDKSVDWSFSYEPILFGQLTFLIEMLASSRKGVVFSASKKMFRDHIKRYPDGDYAFFYDVAREYGYNVKFIETKTDTWDEKKQEVDFAIISGKSELPCIDRTIINYCSKHLFPEIQLSWLDYVSNIKLRKNPKPYSVDFTHAQKTLNLGKGEIIGSLGRINGFFSLGHYDCSSEYSFIKTN